MKKSTHRGFRGPNNFLLARPMFSSRNRTSFFRRRIDRCRCLDRSRCSKTIENGRKNHSVCYMSAYVIKSTHRGSPQGYLQYQKSACMESMAIFRLFSFIACFWASFPHFHFRFTSRFPRSPLYGHPLLFILLSFLPSAFSSLLLFLSFPYSRDKFKSALATRENLFYMFLVVFASF